MLKLLNSNIKVFLILTVVVFIFYGNTLSNGFVYDDVFFIAQNPIIKDLKNIPQILFGCITSDLTLDCQNAGVYYHPLLFLHLSFVSQISQDPWIFHLVNLFLLTLDAILVFKFLEVIVGKRVWAFLGALLFATHPVISELGNFISTINDHYLLIFFILTFLSLNKFIKTGKTKFLVVTLVFYFLDLLAKEVAIFMLVPLLGYFFYIGTKFKFILIFLIPVAAYFLLRLSIFGSLVHNIPGYHDLNLSSQILTSISIYPLYLFKLIYPIPLNAQHDPPVVSNIDWKLFMSIGVWGMSIYLVYYLFKKGFKITVFGFSIIFFSLLPILLLINKIGRFIFSERYLTLAVLGFCLILIDLIPRVSKLFKNTKSEGFFRVISVLFIIYFLTSFYIVFNRNKDWHDELSFNKSIAKYAKENFGVHYNLGINYLNNNELDLAEQSFNKTLSINPNFWQAYYNLGKIYLRKGQISKASDEFKKVIQVENGNLSASNAINNLNLINSATKSANLNLLGDMIVFNNEKLTFKFPIFLNLYEIDEKLILSDGKDFKIEFKTDDLNGLTVEEYLAKQTNVYGNLVNQGLAQIPNVDYAHIKVWQDGQVQRLEFFLFRKNKIINILVDSADTSLMKDFDTILDSLQVK